MSVIKYNSQVRRVRRTKTVFTKLPLIVNDKLFVKVTNQTLETLDKRKQKVGFDSPSLIYIFKSEHFFESFSGVNSSAISLVNIVS